MKLNRNVLSFRRHFITIVRSWLSWESFSKYTKSKWPLMVNNASSSLSQNNCESHIYNKAVQSYLFNVVGFITFLNFMNFIIYFFILFLLVGLTTLTFYSKLHQEHRISTTACANYNGTVLPTRYVNVCREETGLSEEKP